ncbi:MAG: TetR/AcrR family transcriptional regulator [Solirubrobacterales bacterium]|nr:TetR/AcrR family transcriptional regulator [Solirubrobacterales bacterium]
MPKAAPPTPKGAKRVEAIIEAAIRCLGRDGYSASSLRTIAEEAGVGKRAVLYYFDDRQDLLQQVVRRIGDRLLARLADVVAGREDPEEIVSAAFNPMWEAFTQDRALLAAYFGLIAESVTDPELRASTSYINDGVRRVVAELITDAKARGRTPVLPAPVLTETIVAGMQGLTLTYLERGETPELLGTLAAFRDWLAAALPLASE